jgi:hypothetical protein
MKLYKNFGDVGVNNQIPVQEQYGYTPLESLPYPADVPTQFQQQDHQREIQGMSAMKAIRNFDHNKPTNYGQQQMMTPFQQFQEQRGQYILPQYPPQQHMVYQVQCEEINKHVKDCKKCSKKYANDINTYISIIVGLILFIMFLLTKIVDKFT